jgi:spore maturation protein CgeB
MRITLNYERYLRDFLAAESGFLHLSYDEQYQKLVRDGFGWADFLTRNFREFGWEVWEPITNFEAHQKAWAAESGVAYSEKGWFIEITAAQIRSYSPDVLFVDSFIAFRPDFIEQVRKACPSLRLVFGWCGAPFPDASVFRGFDFTLSNIPSLVDDLQRRGLRAQYLPHSFETSLLNELHPSTTLPFTFTGSISDGGENHALRAKLLSRLVRSTPLEIFADLPAATPLTDLIRMATSGKRKRALNTILSSPTYSTLRAVAKPPVFGIKMYQLLADSRISFNNHIGLSEHHASNTRLFQATGCGTCLLTDWKPDLHKFFELDREVVTYRSAGEAREKAAYLLNHESERKAIAQAGQRRTLRDHTFRQRSEELRDLIEKKL